MEESTKKLLSFFLGAECVFITPFLIVTYKWITGKYKDFYDMPVYLGLPFIFFILINIVAFTIYLSNLFYGLV